MAIHHTAVVSPQALLMEGVEIGPYSVIGEDVRIGKNSIVGPHTVIGDHTDIGENCHIFQFCSIGAPPQDLKYRGEKTRVVIGNNNNIREFVTIHRATAADIAVTSVGDNNLIMAYCHIAHNCRLGNNIVMANSANLAGHIHIDDYAIVGGLSGILQFVKLGAHCIVGGASAVTKDVPPFMMVAGNHARLFGLNLVGLKRRNFPETTIEALKEVHRIFFRSQLTAAEAIARISAHVPDLPEVRLFIDFVKKSAKGVCR
jgi:UDP-N-acetylglucosamine acyltransferase